MTNAIRPPPSPAAEKISIALAPEKLRAMVREVSALTNTEKRALDAELDRIVESRMATMRRFTAAVGWVRATLLIVAITAGVAGLVAMIVGAL